MTAPDAFALGGQQDDAELVELEQELHAIAEQMQGVEDDDEMDALGDIHLELLTRINRTPPKTLRGLTVKLRAYAGVHYGAELRNGSDAEAFAEILEFVEQRVEEEPQP
jgi:hypothetical protein